MSADWTGDPRRCVNCMSTTALTERAWPTTQHRMRRLCANCAADLDRWRTVPLVAQKKALRISAPGIARWIRKLLPSLAALALLPVNASGAGQTNDTMYDPEYFPTPRHVITRMLDPYRMTIDVGRKDNSKLEGLTILDPSAGSGALLSYIDDLLHGRERPTLHAIEINPDMQPVLRERFTLVHDDFLTFQPTEKYDLVLMNPPFSNGDAHLEKAWNILEHGDIVCLLNAETIRNPCTARRKWLVKLIEDHGSVEYIGQAFARAERPTEVEVALVRLTKVGDGDGFGFWEQEDFHPEENDFAFNEEGMANMPAVNDRIAAMVSQYKQSQSAFVDYLKARKRLLYYATPLVDRASQVDEAISEAVRQRTGQDCYNTFTRHLQGHAWESIFQRTKLFDVMSSGVRKDFEKMRKQQGGMPFTEANIHALLELLFTNRHVILHKCVEEAFDLMTRYTDSNKSHWEGWKTNDAYKVNRKVIIPDWALRYDREYGSWSAGYGESSWKWDDIDRALAMIEGKTLSSATGLPHLQTRKTSSYSETTEQRPVYRIREALSDRFSELNANRREVKYTHYVDNVCESEYFHIKFWKKGTVHLVFKDERLWQLFNQAAAAGKKWLPMDPSHVPTPKSDPADKRYAERLALDNAENRKLRIAA